MSEHRLRTSLGAAARLGAAATLATALLIGAASMLFARDFGTPKVVILGAGESLSLLVTAGDARVLIATGDDPINFGNALSRVQPWTARRIDVVLAAGDGRSLSVPASFADDAHIRSMVTIGALPASPEASVLAHVPAIVTARRLRLPEGISVNVEPIAVPGNDGEATTTWRAIVERGETRLLIAADGLALGAVPASSSFAAVVVAGADPLVAFGAVDTDLLVVADDAASGAELADIARLVSDSPAMAYRVFPGEALVLSFGDRGLTMPSEGSIALDAADATPERMDTP